MLPFGCEPRCTACGHRSLSMTESLDQKHSFLLKTLAPWADRIGEAEGVEAWQRLGYRDKVSLAALYSEDGWKFGMLQRDEVIPIPDCPVHTSVVNRVFRLLAKYLPQYSEFPLHRVVISGKQLTLILKSSGLPSVRFSPFLSDQLAEAGIEGIWLHLFPSAGRKVFGKGGWHLLAGNPTSADENGLIYGPAAFRQLIPSLARQALNTASGYLKPSVNSVLADLYCGTGSGLKLWTAAGASAIGVELSIQAVKLASLNAPEAKILAGTCTQRIPQINAWNSLFSESYRRLLYVNPPRTGLEPSLTSWIGEDFKPERMAYLSCSQGTLKRDLIQLTGLSYEVEKIQPYDFFPLTRQVECLVLLKRI